MIEFKKQKSSKRNNPFVVSVLFEGSFYGEGGSAPILTNILSQAFDEKERPTTINLIPINPCHIPEIDEETDIIFLMGITRDDLIKRAVRAARERKERPLKIVALIKDFSSKEGQWTIHNWSELGVEIFLAVKEKEEMLKFITKLIEE